MIALLLAAASAHAMTALDAERQFAADARKLGQWTAFRKWAAPDAIMFVPQPVKAQEWLKGRKDPPVAVQWKPSRMAISCDRNTAVTTGRWKRPSGTGYFTTIWRRQRDGSWKWVLDHGDDEAHWRGLIAVREQLGPSKKIGGAWGQKILRWEDFTGTRRAACYDVRPKEGFVTVHSGFIPDEWGRSILNDPSSKQGEGAASDGSLIWNWATNADGRVLLVELASGPKELTYEFFDRDVFDKPK